MTDETELMAREQAALFALEHIRATVAAVPRSHPAGALLAEVLALAEHHWQECQAAIEAAAKTTDSADSTHPGDYWSARWRA